MRGRRTVGRLATGTALAAAAMAGASAQDLPSPAAHIQRQADNPMRWIIEAGKLKPRVKAVDAGASRPVIRSVVARSNVVPPARVADAATPAPLPASVPAEAPSTALELLAGDEPTLPDEIDAQLTSDAMVDLALIVLADGSVGALSVLASTHQAVDDHAMAAVRGWRFRPLAQAQVHNVELVIHPRH